MTRATLMERVAARRLWRIGWTIGAVTAGALALLGIESRSALDVGAWLVVLALAAVATGGLALSWRSPAYGGAVVLAAGCVLVPVVAAVAEGDRRLALAMVSAPFVVAGSLIVLAAWLVTDRR